MNSNNRTSANDLYNVYLVPEELHGYKDGYEFTEGVYDITTYENCLWLFDLILDQKTDADPETQIWCLKRMKQDFFMLTCKNKEGRKCAEIKNVEACFYFDDLTIIKKGKLFCLPIEENIY
ncbi:hypothetical protein IQ37_19225 [Chryseobacterium piperi]|uniref:DUF6876 domain-containing protein n=1 Tax=Chryseobacterium piperi TaxID=558152 RepID=A0A086A968_9FLAO|nr:DUF6876 family protein [Chryseobacterium piperi]ASW75267.1 hypothetical protein CJF12_13870 [Chryseobacterium piperi]KFF13232.1 hypothetical protein IQ37_19225 [Chryseobacterium piperi]